MNTKLTFKTKSPDLIRAAMGFAAKDDARYYINGVAILPAKCGGIVIAATNGYVLFVGHDDTGSASGPMLLKMAKKDSASLVIENDRAYLDSHLISAMPFNTIKYCDILIVTPDTEPTEPTEPAHCWSATQMGFVVAGCKILKTIGFSLSYGEANRSAVVRFGMRADCYAVLMPLAEGLPGGQVVDLAVHLRAGGGLVSGGES